MKTKFTKSNINIGGVILITKEYEDACEVSTDLLAKIPVSGLNQSKSGIYCLRNKLNGRLYIGMARNLETRMNRHFRDLNTGNHSNDILQKDFDIKSIDEGMNNRVFDATKIFEFEVIIYCYPSELTFWEKILIDNLHPYYNVKKKKYTRFGCDPILDKPDFPVFSHIYNGDSGLIDVVNADGKIVEYYELSSDEVESLDNNNFHDICTCSHEKGTHSRFFDGLFIRCQLCDCKKFQRKSE